MLSRASLLSPSSARRAWYTILQDSEKKDSKCRFDILRTTFEFSEYVLNGSALPQEHDEETSKNAPAMPVAGFQRCISWRRWAILRARDGKKRLQPRRSHVLNQILRDPCLARGSETVIQMYYLWT